MSLVTAGQAELITGFCISFSSIYVFVAIVTSSAARATSKTSSNPNSLSPFNTRLISGLFLNCTYNDGAGNAILYLYLCMEESLSVTAFLARYGHTFIHSPQSMQRSFIILALPFLTLIASVGHLFIQLVHPLHKSLSRVTE